MRVKRAEYAVGLDLLDAAVLVAAARLAEIAGNGNAISALGADTEAQNGRRLITGPEGRPIVILECCLEREHVGQAGRFPELAGAFDAGLELATG